MLDDCDYEGLIEVAESKQQIVDKIVALDFVHLMATRPYADCEDVQALVQQANGILIRISEVDRRNLARFERLRSEACEGLQISRDERRLRSTYGLAF
jgi:hypothetical protein